MIVLDTNVISELLRPAPDAAVARWAAAMRPRSFYTTAISEAELLLGVALMPTGRRRDNLAATLAAIFAGVLEDRILGFDSASAPHYVAIVARRRDIGRPIAQSDAQIAAICRRHGAAIATRDAGGFDGLEIEIVNPWTD
ncbi:MAG: type II toxin-antitoxin system VapC family toxin [Aestuariivirga sp.]